MSRRTGTVAVAVAAWLAIVASTSTVSWVVIDRAGRGAHLTDGAGPEITRAGPGPTTGPTTGGTISATSDLPTSTSRATSSAPHSSGVGPHPTSSPVGPTPIPSTSRPASTPRPSGQHSTSKSPGSSSTPAQPPVVEGSVSVTGGSVGVSCRGTTLTLRFATPRNGWSYSIDRAPDQIEVQFRRNGGEQESEVRARCSGGAPVFETSSSEGTEHLSDDG